ncbi:hypothetical protein D3C75_519750 [compost metagenome]
MVEFGVVQHRRVFIQRHNVAVRHVSIPVAGRRQVSLVDIELAHAGQEGFMGRTMAVNRRFLRFTHTRQLIVGLIRAVIVQVINHAFRVDIIGGNIQTTRTFRHWTDVADIAACSR